MGRLAVVLGYALKRRAPISTSFSNSVSTRSGAGAIISVSISAGGHSSAGAARRKVPQRRGEGHRALDARGVRGDDHGSDELMRAGEIASCCGND